MILIFIIFFWILNLEMQWDKEVVVEVDDASLGISMIDEGSTRVTVQFRMLGTIFVLLRYLLKFYAPDVQGMEF